MKNCQKLPKTATLVASHKSWMRRALRSRNAVIYPVPHRADFGKVDCHCLGGRENGGNGDIWCCLSPVVSRLEAVR